MFYWMSTQYAILCVAASAAILYVLFGSSNAKTSNRGGKLHGPATPAGLMNLGQTCFFNAILQALASCQSVVCWIEEESRVNQTAVKIVSLLQLLFGAMNNGDSSHSDSSILMQLLDEIRAKGWVVDHSEHDAHEVYQALISLLHEDKEKEVKGLNIQLPEPAEAESMDIILRSRVQTTKVARDTQSPLLGYITSTMRCKSCFRKTPSRYESFSSLSLTFPPCLGPFKLENLLKFYFVSDTLSAVQCDNCTQKGFWDNRSDFLRETSIGKLPEVLCVHIQRLAWLSNGMPAKRHDQVIFPLLLHLRNQTQLAKMLTSPILQSPRLGFNEAASNRSGLYALKALVEHQGSADSGHFVTYRRFCDRWIYTSDMNVRQVSPSEVLARSPYMLFYEKVKSTAPS